MVAAALIVGEAPAADLIPTTTSEMLVRGKRPRKKKGFLWGLFRKNDCGCPKH